MKTTKATPSPEDQTPSDDKTGDVAWKKLPTTLQLAELAARLPVSDPRTRVLRTDDEHVRAALKLYRAAQELIESEQRIARAESNVTDLPVSLSFTDAAEAVGFYGEKAALSLERLMASLGWSKDDIASARKLGLTLPAVAQLQEALAEKRSEQGKKNRLGKSR